MKIRIHPKKKPTPKRAIDILPFHPGQAVKQHLDDHDLSQYRAAKMLGVIPIALSQVIRGTRSISVEMALRMQRAFLEVSATQLLDLQARYDLMKLANSDRGKAIIAEVNEYEEEHEEVA